MNQIQRIVVVIYCLLLAYCCIWVPWQIVGTVGSAPEHKISNIIYSPVWDAPIGSYETSPDMRLIILRAVAITAIAGAAFVSAGIAKASR
jgi:hypothetical protein